jgi:DNA polymerase-3 subunit delta
MIYVLYGIESYSINKEINLIIKNNNLNDINIAKYDFTIDALGDILEEANTYSMFNSKKAIILDNSTFLTGSKQDTDITKLELYLSNPNPDTLLILKVNNEKIDRRKKLVKNLLKSATVKEFNNADMNITKELFNGYSVSNNNLNLFVNRVGSDIFMQSNEADKLKMYKVEDKIINEDDILALTRKSIDTNIFNLITNIVSNNKIKAIESYNEMLKYNTEPMMVLVMLANQFRLIYQTKNLNKLSYSEKNMADILNIHPYRVKKALEKSRDLSNEDLLKYIEALADLDRDIKIGNVDSKESFELFILTA